MLIDCPHCYSHVLPKPDDRCPSCGHNVKDRRGADRTKAELVVKDSDNLPSICLTCGDPTDQTARVRFHKADPDDPDKEVAAVLMLVSLFAALLAYLVRPRRGIYIDMRLPQCRSCKKQTGKPEPRHIAWDSRELTFVVHRKFRDAVIARRRAPVPA